MENGAPTLTDAAEQLPFAVNGGKAMVTLHGGPFAL
jgi:hypothetical protein